MGSSWDDIKILRDYSHYNYDNSFSFSDFNLSIFFDVIILSFDWLENLAREAQPGFKEKMITKLKSQIVKASITNPQEKIFFKDGYETYKYWIDIGDNDFRKLSLIIPIRDPFKYLRLKIYQPDLKILSFLRGIFTTFSAMVSEVEVALDFYPIKSRKSKPSKDELFLLFQKLYYFAYLKNPGEFMKKEMDYATTRYLNNIRNNSSKGARIYIDNKNISPKYVRLEIVLKRRYLHSSQVRTIDDIINVNPGVLVKSIQFMNINFKRLNKRFFERNSALPDIRMFYDHFYEILEDRRDKINLGNASQYIKAYTDGISCLVPHPFNAVFHKWVKEQRLLQ